VAIVPQRELFCWENIEELGDLIRLKLVLDNLPDEELMQSLEGERKNGRDDYPVRVIWNSILAGLIFEHNTIESLRRELSRNSQLRDVCGFDLWKGIEAIPPSYVYSRFLRKLLANQDLISKMFHELVEECRELLPDFGQTLAIDGKAISSFAKKIGKKENDGRSEMDADWGKHVHKGKDDGGTPWEKVKKWFGFKLHLIVDAKYELPIEFTVTKASVGEQPIAHRLFERVERSHPEILERCKHALGDKGFDDGKLHEKLWDRYKCKPIIDIRNCWKDHDETKLVPDTENVIYDYKGTINCVCPLTGIERKMAYAGFEQDRNSLKYRCPAKHYKYKCNGKEKCPIKSSVRIPLDIDRRVFSPVARDSYKWPRIYKMRTAVERVFSRLDNQLGFEKHTIRGHKKMSFRVGLSLCVMLAMAIGKIKENKDKNFRSLLRSA
jgi:hypothetical protein